MSEAYVFRWVLKGGISMDRRRHGMPGTGEYVPLRGFWKAVRAGLPVDRLAHCWVLRQQGPGCSCVVFPSGEGAGEVVPGLWFVSVCSCAG